MANSNLDTRASLLLDLKDPGNEEAWSMFFDFYRPLIIGYVCQRGGSESMATDVLQETLMTLLRTMPDFDYDPAKGGFRSYLLTIVTNHLNSAFRRERKYICMASHSDREGLEVDRSAADSGNNAPYGEWNRAWDRQVLMLALQRVRANIEPDTFESFRLYVLEELPVKQVCDVLRIEPNLVYQHRHRVLEMLRREAAKLVGEHGELR